MKKFELRKERFDIQEICKEAIELLQMNAEYKGTYDILNVNLQNNMIYNDPLKLKQILINSFGNSVKFT